MRVRIGGAALGLGLLLAACSSQAPRSSPAAVPVETPTTPASPAVTQTGGPGLQGVPFPQWFWQRPLSDDVALDPRSSAMAADLARQVSDSRARDGYHVFLNTTDYAPPVFRADASTPTVRVRGTSCQGKSAATMQAWSDTLGDVPIPADARPSPGTDHQLVVWQPSSDTVWELWVADRSADGSWSACWGGRLENASRSNGVFPFPYGTAASGLSQLGGVITPAEVASGVIPHALSAALPSTAAQPVSPANRTDGTGPVATQLAEGSRFRLPPDYPVTGTPAQQTVIEALKKYGAVVSDKAGAVVFFGENVKAETGTDPWPAALGGTPAYTLFDGIDWSKVQVVDPAFNAP